MMRTKILEEEPCGFFFSTAVTLKFCYDENDLVVVNVFVFCFVNLTVVAECTNL